MCVFWNASGICVKQFSALVLTCILLMLRFRAREIKDNSPHDLEFIPSTYAVRIKISYWIALLIKKKSYWITLKTPNSKDICLIKTMCCS